MILAQTLPMHFNGPGSWPSYSVVLWTSLIAVGCGRDADAPMTQDDIDAKQCPSPQPWVEGKETGFEVCDRGYLRRTAAITCPTHLPRPESLEPIAGMGGADGLFDECRSDADCETGRYCGQWFSGEFETKYLACLPSCRTDADCGSNGLCLCGEDFGVCQRAKCRSDDDCGDFACIGVYTHGQCWGPPTYSFSCQHPDDECSDSRECSGKDICASTEDGHQCDQGSICE